MLTESELQLIRDEAEMLYPLDNPRKNMHHDNQCQIAKQEVYIAALTKERERAKKNIEKAIVDEWKDKFGEMDKELDGIGIYFITGFVSSAIERLSNYQSKTP